MTERIKFHPRDAFIKHVLRRLRRERITETKNLYATVEDIRHIFADEMDSLYQLCFLLTGDPELAEQCFVAGLEDAVKENQVFKDWARGWAKRAIIKNAVRAVRASALHPIATDLPHRSADGVSNPEHPYSAVLALPNFERFVFAVTVLERYSDHDAALLLDCSADAVHDARVRALEQIATVAKRAESGALVS